VFRQSRTLFALETLELMWAVKMSYISIKMFPHRMGNLKLNTE